MTAERTVCPRFYDVLRPSLSPQSLTSCCSTRRVPMPSESRHRINRRWRLVPILGYSVNNLSITLAGGTYPAGPARFCGLPVAQPRVGLAGVSHSGYKRFRQRGARRVRNRCGWIPLIGEVRYLGSSGRCRSLPGLMRPPCCWGRNGHGERNCLPMRFIIQVRAETVRSFDQCAALPDQLFETNCSAMPGHFAVRRRTKAD